MSPALDYLSRRREYRIRQSACRELILDAIVCIACAAVFLVAAWKG